MIGSRQGWVEAPYVDCPASLVALADRVAQAPSGALSIVPGVTPTIWEFSVRNEAVVPRLNGALGKRVVLHYSEHRGIPTTCFGHTGYFVDSVTVLQ